MKNILIVVANPKIDSLSMSIANKVKEVNETAGNSVEVVDLYRDKAQPFLPIRTLPLVLSQQKR